MAFPLEICNNKEYSPLSKKFTKHHFTSTPKQSANAETHAAVMHSNYKPKWKSAYLLLPFRNVSKWCRTWDSIEVVRAIWQSRNPLVAPLLLAAIPA